jgi:hypothetical protein|tara:strand:+ start:406 stop:1026 length:621 start_codon:yes stop_codon:yes gene_type:complete
MSKSSRLYAFGCSFTNYNNKQLCWPEYLGKKLDLEVVNFGWSGYSNNSIFMETVETMLGKTVDGIPRIDTHGLVVIGLTDMARQKLFQADITGQDPNPIRHMNRYFVDIMLMQSFLEKHNINYRMFSTLAPSPREEKYYKNFFLKTIQDKIDYEKIIGWPFFKELGGYSMWHFLQEDKSRMTKDFHPTEKAHEDWAEYLYNEIRKT